MGKNESDRGAKPSGKDARRDRQAKGLRENLLRRKAQSRARSLEPEKPLVGSPDDDDSD